MRTVRKRTRVLGIVGAEAAKFTPAWKREAKRAIRISFIRYRPDLVVSGDCHLGGIDKWAIEEARKRGIATREFPPKHQSWKYYKARNIQIAKASDLVLCIAVRHYPPHFRGRHFPLCYHCKKTDHIKSGGCWTRWYAQTKLGKLGDLIIVGD